MDLDPRTMQDWEIAEAAEDRMKPIQQLAAELGLRGDELIPYGCKLGKVDYQKVLARLQDAPLGKYIDVTAITPTPLGEGKTTTTVGLIESLGHLGNASAGPSASRAARRRSISKARRRGAVWLSACR
jgi:formate--tetrahydrofolate ligase